MEIWENVQLSMKTGNTPVECDIRMKHQDKHAAFEMSKPKVFFKNFIEI